MNRPIFLIDFIIASVGLGMAVLGLGSDSTNPINSYLVGGIVIAIVGAFVAIYGASQD